MLWVQKDSSMGWKWLLGYLWAPRYLGCTVRMRMCTSHMKHSSNNNSIDRPNYFKQVSGLVQIQCLLCVTGSLFCFKGCSNCCVHKGEGKVGVEIRGVPLAYKTPLFLTWGLRRSPELPPGLQYKKDWTILTNMLSKSLTFMSSLSIQAENVTVGLHSWLR